MRLSTTAKLKIIAFSSGMMFWYGIEQLFMDNVIHDPNTRALATSIYIITLLVLDIPGGIIADRFGRRKTILLGAVLQAAGVLLMGLSRSMTVFLVGVFAYGVYWALCNGAAQAMMYDHLLETRRHSEYAKQQGSAYAYSYLGAGFANLLSGFIAHFLGYRAPYVLSVIPALVALAVAFTLHETHHKDIQNSRRLTLLEYPRQLIATVKRSKIASVYAIQIIIGILVFMTICEFGQITLLKYGMSSIWLGIIWAVDAGIVALALHYAHKLQKRPWQTTFGYVAILLLFATFVVNPVLGTLLFMATYAGVEVVHNISETELQHMTDSRARATVLSSVNFIGNLLAVGAVWVFNHLLQSHGIFIANQYIAVTIAGMLIITASAIAVQQKRRVQI